MEEPSITCWKASDALNWAMGRPVSGLFARNGERVLVRGCFVPCTSGDLRSAVKRRAASGDDLPLESRGEGLGMAARCQAAVIADPEFVQFHPTAIAIGRDPARLAT